MFWVPLPGEVPRDQGVLKRDQLASGRKKIDEVWPGRRRTLGVPRNFTLGAPNEEVVADNNRRTSQSIRRPDPP